MAASRLPLLTWAAAINAVLSKPTLRVAELAEAVGIKRRATVRSMRSRIMGALSSDDPGPQLGWLDDRALRTAESRVT